jgi:hypothetical protein
MTKTLLSQHVPSSNMTHEQVRNMLYTAMPSITESQRHRIADVVIKLSDEDHWFPDSLRRHLTELENTNDITKNERHVVENPLPGTSVVNKHPAAAGCFYLLDDPRLDHRILGYRRRRRRRRLRGFARHALAFPLPVTCAALTANEKHRDGRESDEYVDRANEPGHKPKQVLNKIELESADKPPV